MDAALREEAAKVLRLSPSRIPADRPLQALGLKTLHGLGTAQSAGTLLRAEPAGDARIELSDAARSRQIYRKSARNCLDAAENWGLFVPRAQAFPRPMMLSWNCCWQISARSITRKLNACWPARRGNDRSARSCRQPVAGATRSAWKQAREDRCQSMQNGLQPRLSASSRPRAGCQAMCDRQTISGGC